MKKTIVIFSAAIILLTSCGVPESAEAIVTTTTTTTAIEMTTAAETTIEVTPATKKAITTTTEPPITTIETIVTEPDISNYYSSLFEGLINKNEFNWYLGINDVSYNYLIENIDISDYEILNIDDEAKTFDRQFKIRVNVTRSDAPHFPVGERIWIIEDNGYIDVLCDSESNLSYLRYTYIDEKTYYLSIVAANFSYSFDCYETVSVDEFLEKHLANTEPLRGYGITSVYETGIYTWIMRGQIPEPEPPQPIELYDIFPAEYINTVLYYSLVTDIDMNDYCEQVDGKIWAYWESSGEYGSYEITDDYVEITYYADWSHIVPAKTVRYFFDDSEMPRLERLELIEDFGYEPCTSNPYI